VVDRTTLEDVAAGLNEAPLDRNQNRFWSYVDRSGDCWEWKGSHSRSGYGCFCFNNKRRMAHRIAYEYVVGAIPAGLVIDHLCRNRACVNPAHLEPVTNRENVVRGIGGALLKARNASITHCPQGHEYTPDNTRLDKKRSRNCRICERAHTKRLTKRRQEIRARARTSGDA
jgi:hypothetical protein